MEKTASFMIGSESGMGLQNNLHSIFETIFIQLKGYDFRITWYVLKDYLNLEPIPRLEIFNDSLKVFSEASEEMSFIINILEKNKTLTSFIKAIKDEDYVFKTL
jgi:hypothetical protein